MVPAETTDAIDEASAVTVVVFRFDPAALRLALKPDTAVDRASTWVAYWPCASVFSVCSSCWIFVSWAETAEVPFSLTLTFLRSCSEAFRSFAVLQTAGWALALAFPLAVALAPLVVVLLLQAARNAALITHAVASPRRCRAVMRAGCQGPGDGRVTRTG